MCVSGIRDISSDMSNVLHPNVDNMATCVTLATSESLLGHHVVIKLSCVGPAYAQELIRLLDMLQACCIIWTHVDFGKEAQHIVDAIHGTK